MQQASIHTGDYCDSGQDCSSHECSLDTRMRVCLLTPSHRLRRLFFFFFCPLLRGILPFPDGQALGLSYLLGVFIFSLVTIMNLDSRFVGDRALC